MIAYAFECRHTVDVESDFQFPFNDYVVRNVPRLCETCEVMRMVNFGVEKKPYWTRELCNKVRLRGAIYRDEIVLIDPKAILQIEPLIEV